MIKTETIVVEQWKKGGPVVLEVNQINGRTEYFSSVEEGVKKIKAEQLKNRIAMGISGAIGAVTILAGIRELVTVTDGIIHGIGADSEHVYPGLVYLYLGSQILSWSKEYFDRQGLDKRILIKLSEMNQK